MNDVYSDEDYQPRDEILEAVAVTRPTDRDSETLSPTPGPDGEDPGLNVLLDASGYNNTVLRTFRKYQPGVEDEMVDQPDDDSMRGRTLLIDGITAEAHRAELTDARLPAPSLAQASSSDLRKPGSVNVERESRSPALATRAKVDRVDSAQDDPESLKDEPFVRPAAKSPLKVDTASQHTKNDSISDSPILSKHTLPAAEEQGDRIAPFEPLSSHTKDSNLQLPSFQQLTGLAEAATAAAERNRSQGATSHHHSRSFGSAPPQSPMAQHQYPTNMQSSPQAYYPPGASVRSPTSTISESQQYASPSPYALYNAGTAHRRPSYSHGPPPGFPPSLPSASSSGGSHGYTGSSTDGQSTSHTTPIDLPYTFESTPRPPMMQIQMLPPPPGMVPPPPPMMVPGPFQCDVPGCNTGTFQTQYLLSSHKNVHSHSRPHYCPVDGCARAEGGKGFKRKNEMIRHGLVHNSPGYVCPFCPEREHRYPRPDNLQRHVRVHHMDKSKDDPLLRDVLDQRTEGQGKSRRRRTGASDDVRV